MGSKCEKVIPLGMAFASTALQSPRMRRASNLHLRPGKQTVIDKRAEEKSRGR
jgi:hypothetical protein